MNDKNPYTQKHNDNAKNATYQKTSITQRLSTDLGRLVGVTTATQLVWLNRFTGSKHSHSPQKLGITVDMTDVSLQFGSFASWFTPFL